METCSPTQNLKSRSIVAIVPTPRRTPRIQRASGVSRGVSFVTSRQIFSVLTPRLTPEARQGTPKTRWACVSFLIVVALLCLLPSRRACAEPIDAVQVLTAIDRGVSYLQREQNERGRWTEMGRFDGGVTALCTLALLNSGVDPNDASVRKALVYLRRIEPKWTYTVSLQTMVLCAADPKRFMPEIQRNVEWLEAIQIAEGNRKGCWSYPGGGGDNSNAQFAILALHEARRAGATVQPETWKRAVDYWERTQNEDGSWGYTPGGGGSGSMVCAGIGGLVIAREESNLADAKLDLQNDKISCCATQADDDRIDRAMEWLDKHFSVRSNPRPHGEGQPCLYYYLYGMERAGRLTARRFIGEHDWYREGAEFLVNDQDGLMHYWRGNWHGERNPHVSSALALLFLSKGRRPILMAKVKYGDDQAWTSHRHDAANLTLQTEKSWGMDLTWQVMDIKTAKVEDLMHSPVLYISGSQAFDLSDQATKLRDYVDRGGFLFAEACCTDSRQFKQSFQQLMKKVFPESEYRLRQISPNHPIWRMETLVRPESPYIGKLWAVEYGCRTCVVFSEEDLSCYWEAANPQVLKNIKGRSGQRIRDAYAVGVNVLTYATNREPLGKEQSFAMEEQGGGESQARGRGMIEIAKLKHGGGCNDAPGALLNLLRTASQGDLKLRINTEQRMISIGDKSLFQYHMAFMHGRHDFRLTNTERKQLGLFLERGGTLLADSVCASRSFTNAFRREISASLASATWEKIPADDPIWSNKFGGTTIGKVRLREPARGNANDQLTTRVSQISPELYGMKINGRWAVIFSPHDISCALEKHEAVGCKGYVQQDAAKLALNVLLYSLNF